MSPEIAAAIQAEQNHGREKYGFGAEDFDHDDMMPDHVWHDCITDHNKRGQLSGGLDRRQHLIKVAGLAVSAIEAYDRNNTSQPSNPSREPTRSQSKLP